ncbi:MAG: PKD repeat protein, partial [Polaromonas sp.]
WWDFGDGASASGAQVSHGYGAPGTYTVTVTARDATGLASGVTSDTATITAEGRGN